MMSGRCQLGFHAPHTGNLWKGYLTKMLSKMKLWEIPNVSIYSYSMYSFHKGMQGTVTTTVCFWKFDIRVTEYLVPFWWRSYTRNSLYRVGRLYNNVGIAWTCNIWFICTHNWDKSLSFALATISWYTDHVTPLTLVGEAPSQTSDQIQLLAMHVQ